jgi:hypothetical protein
MLPKKQIREGDVDEVCNCAATSSSSCNKLELLQLPCNKLLQLPCNKLELLNCAATRSSCPARCNTSSLLHYYVSSCY